MDLLRRITGRPVRRSMVRGELDADPRLAVDDHRMPIVVPLDLGAEDSSPERALRIEIRCVEGNNLIPDLHRWHRTEMIQSDRSPR